MSEATRDDEAKPSEKPGPGAQAPTPRMPEGGEDAELREKARDKSSGDQNEDG